MDMTLYALTGPRGAGKTTLCQRLIAQAKRTGCDVAGVISPAVIMDGQRAGFDVEDIRSGARRGLGRASPQPGFSLSLGRWFVNPSALAWANQILSCCCPCDLLIVDEVGPLELVQGDGWTNGLVALRTGPYRVAVVVVRPELLETARAVLPIAASFDVQQQADRERLVAQCCR
jgi:nucleoside-triphosphatase THEP1